MKYVPPVARSLTFLSLFWSALAGAATPKFVEASKTCMAFWETIALDASSEKDQFAGIILTLKGLQSEAGLVLPRPLLQNTQTEVQMIMRTLSPVCQAFRLRAGSSEGDAPVWIDASTGRSSAYCPEGTPDNGNGFGAVAGHECKILGSIDDTLLELDEVARRFQLLSNRIEGNVLGNAKLAIAELDAKLVTGELSSEAAEKLEVLKEKSVKFTNFWLMVNKAWQQLSSDAARLARVDSGEDAMAQDAKQCPADSCVFERTFCYVPAKRYAVAYYEGEEWKWWGNGSAPVDSSLSSMPPEFTTKLFHSGSRLKKEVPNSKLSLVTTPRGMCKPEELKGFNLSLSKVDVPTTEPDPSALKPDPSINTTEPENNQPGVACPADVLTHRESRWFDLPVDGEGVVPGAMLKLCNDGVVKIEKVRCNPGYAPRNNACVRASPGGTQPPPPPPPSDCDAAGLLDGETQDSDMPAEPTGVPGKWLKKCESGAIKVVGIVCHAGWTKQGNACVADGRPPLEETNECKTFGLGEGDTRFEDMPQVDGEVRGRFQITCVNGALERDFFCLKPWYRAGDRCEGGEQPDDSLPPLPDSDPSTNPDVTPGGDVEPTGGVPGNGGLTISFGGSLIGGISQLVTDLLNILFQSGSLPPLPGQLIFQAGCLKQGGSCLTTPSGGTITLGPLGTLVDSITQQDIKAGGNPLVLSNNGKMLIDLLTGQAVVSGPFTIGGQPILTTGGSGSIFNLIGNALNTGTPLGTPPASPAAPVNIDGTSERPKFTNVNWLKALNAPGTGTPRPDSVNIPNGLGNGGSSLRDCVVNGIVYGNGREWTQNAQGGMVVRYRCDDGTVRELSRACSDGYTNEGGQCRRGCRVGDRFYRHGQRWDQVSASSVQYLTCENGSVRVYDSGCVSGYSQDAQGQCQRDCAPGYPSGSSGVFDIANGKGNYTCDRGNWLFSSVASCNAGYTQSGNACVVLTRDCAWPQGGSLGHGQRRRVDINGGYVEFSCNNGQLTSDGAACYQGYQSGQSTPRFPYYTCAEIPPKRNCSYTYRYMHEDMVLTINHGTIGTYLFQNGRIQAYCDDGTLRARGLPVCDPGFVFPGGVLGALGSIVLGNSNMQCTPGPR